MVYPIIEEFSQDVSPYAISSSKWTGSCVGSESTLHQIAPYIGKMKSTMAKALVREFSEVGDTVLDPFVGSGVVALECLIEGRNIVAVDINPYAVLLTKAKMEAPSTLSEATSKVGRYIKEAESSCQYNEPEEIPNWVKAFFHPRTLGEIIRLNSVLMNNDEYFLQACLMGILHHQRPGFLSYPASHLVPYLRTRAFPKDKYPEAYDYRAVEPRLLAKVRRIYRRFPSLNQALHRECVLNDAANLNLEANSIDSVITSPPYMNALDYARDNRLRLWFLGVDDHHAYDKLANTKQKFIELMQKCLGRIFIALKPNGKCVLVLGEVSSSKVDIAETVVDIAINKVGGFRKLDIIEDNIPDVRRSRRDCRCTKREWVIVLQKRIQNAR